MNGVELACIILATGLAFEWIIEAFGSVTTETVETTETTETTKFDLIENLIEELDDLRDDYGYDLDDTEKDILDNKIRVREETLKTLLASE